MKHCLRKVLILVTVLVSMFIMAEIAFADEQGAVAYWYSYDDDGNLQYYPVEETSNCLNMTDLKDHELYMGAWASQGFVSAKNISCAEMVIRQNGQEVSRESVAVGETVMRGGELAGIDYGIGYECAGGSGEVSKIYDMFSFSSTADIYKYWTELAGKYEISLKWTADGTSYSAELNWTLEGCSGITSVMNVQYNDAGEISDFWGNTLWRGETEIVYFEHNALTAYQNGDDKTIRKYIYTDSTVNGIYSFVGCDSEELKEIFTAGEPIKFDNDLTVTPLCENAYEITDEMLGKSCTLTFKNGTAEKKITVQIRQAANGYMEKGKIYVFDRHDNVVVNDDKSISIYIWNNNEIDEWSAAAYFKDEVIVTQSEWYSTKSWGSEFVFAEYHDGKLWPLELASLSSEDEKILELIPKSSTDGVYRYDIEALKKGIVYLKAKNDSEMKIACRTRLPYVEIFTERQRSDEAQLDEIYYTNIAKDGEKEICLYLMACKEAHQRPIYRDTFSIKACGSCHDAEGNAKYGYHDIDGITFTPDGIYRDEAEDADYYVWKMIITDQYKNYDDGYIGGFYIRGGNKQSNGHYEYSVGTQDGAGVRIHDVTELPGDATKYGDIDGDGNINSADSICLKRCVAGWYGYNNSIKKNTADLNRDGLIDSADLMILERHIAGWTGYETLPKVR